MTFVFMFIWLQKYAKYRMFYYELSVTKFPENSYKHPPFVLNKRLRSRCSRFSLIEVTNLENEITALCLVTNIKCK